MNDRLKCLLGRHDWHSETTGGASGSMVVPPLWTHQGSGDRSGGR